MLNPDGNRRQAEPDCDTSSCHALFLRSYGVAWILCNLIVVWSLCRSGRWGPRGVLGVWFCFSSELMQLMFCECISSRSILLLVMLWGLCVICILFVWFSLFLHVAQLSIALGRHTLPHVRVKWITEARKTVSGMCVLYICVCVCTQLLVKRTCFWSDFAAVSVAGEI